MDEDAHGMQVGLGPGDIVLPVDGDPSPPPEKGVEHSPHFQPMSIVAKRLYVSGCHLIGTEVGLSLGDILLDGDPAPPPLKGHVMPPIFGQCPL